MLMFSVNISLDAQVIDSVLVSFNYDAAGNRTTREIDTVFVGGLKSLANQNYLDIEEIEVMEDIKVYPNPFNESFYLALNEEAYESDSKTMYIYDNLGKLIKEIPLYEYINEIDAADLKEGLYILKLRYNNISREWIVIKN